MADAGPSGEEEPPTLAPDFFYDVKSFAREAGAGVHLYGLLPYAACTSWLPQRVARRVDKFAWNPSMSLDASSMQLPCCCMLLTDTYQALVRRRSGFSLH